MKKGSPFSCLIGKYLDDFKERKERGINSSNIEVIEMLEKILDESIVMEKVFLHKLIVKNGKEKSKGGNVANV
jgi:hypothetical protein